MLPMSRGVVSRVSQTGFTCCFLMWLSMQPEICGAQTVVDVSAAPSWDLPASEHDRALWKAQLGSMAGPPAIAGDVIVVGTNTDIAHSAGHQVDGGMIVCLRAADGRPLWHREHLRLPDRHHDLPSAPIRSRPAVDQSRLYYVSNRGELVCLDVKGFDDDKDCGQNDSALDKMSKAGDVVWTLDMVKELGIHKQDDTAFGNPICSPLVIGSFVYCVTGNSADFRSVPAPDAPSFLAADKATGRIVWTSNIPGSKIVYGQWASPIWLSVGEESCVAFPGGDGVLYGFEPTQGALRWRIDCASNGADQKETAGSGHHLAFWATPTVERDNIYVGLHRPYESLEDRLKTGPEFLSIRVGEGDVMPRIRWEFKDEQFDGTFGSAVVWQGKVFILSRGGTLFVLDSDSGAKVWISNLNDDASPFCSPYVHENVLYVPTSTELFVFSLGDVPRCRGRYAFDGLVQSTPISDGRALYVCAGKYLWALKVSPD